MLSNEETQRKVKEAWALFNANLYRLGITEIKVCCLDANDTLEEVRDITIEEGACYINTVNKSR